VIDVLGDWGAHWAFGEPRTDELDPIALLWWMRRKYRGFATSPGIHLIRGLAKVTRP
jgi:hypothetical protein